MHARDTPQSGEPLAAPTLAPTLATPVGAIARGGSWAFAGLAVGAALQFGYNVALARMYGAAATGVFAFSLSLTAVAAIVSQVGARETLLRFVASYRAAGEPALERGVLLFAMGLGLAVSLVAGALLSALAPTVAAWADKPEVAGALGVLAWTVPLVAGTSAAAASLQSIRRIDLYTALYDVGRPAAVVAGLGAAFALGLRFEAFLWLYLGASALVLGTGLVAMMAHLPVLQGTAPAWRPREWLGFSLAVSTLDAFRSAGGWMDTLVLGFFVDTADVGIYFAALRTALLITLALNAFSTIISPLTAEAWARGDMAELGRVYALSTRWTTAFVIPITVATVLLRTDLLSAFGDDFLTPTSGLVLLIILLGRFVHGLTGGVGRLLIMTGHQRVELMDTVGSAVLLLGGMLWAVPRYGLVGAAIVNASGVALVNLLKLGQVRWLLGVQPYTWSFLKQGVAGAAALGAGWGTRVMTADVPLAARLVLVGVATAAVFGGALAAQGIEPEDRAVLDGLRRRLSR